jgi:hypothetical protein
VGSVDGNFYAFGNAAAAPSQGTSNAAAFPIQGPPGLLVMLVFVGLVFVGLVITAYAVKTYRY